MAMSRRGWRMVSSRGFTVTVTVTNTITIATVLTTSRAICLGDGVCDGVFLVRSEIVEIHSVQETMVDDVTHDFIFHVAQVDVRLTEQRTYTGLM